METKKPQRKVGKRAEPTSEELEFIYSCFARKLSDGETLEEMKDEPFELRSRGFIKRARKQYDAAKKALEMKSEGIYDVDERERHKRHQVRLADRSQEILAKLKTFFPYTDDRLLADVVIDDNDYEFGTLMEDFRSACLLSHLKSESPALVNFDSWATMKISDIPTLLKLLGLCAETQEFRGTCEVCNDWGI